MSDLQVTDTSTGEPAIMAVEDAPDVATRLERGLVFAHRAIEDHEVLQHLLRTEPSGVLPQLRAVAPRPVRFVDGGEGIARRIAFLTGGAEWPDCAPPGVAVFTRLGDAERELAPALAARGFPTIEAL